MVWTSFISAKCQSFLKKFFGFVGLHAHTHPFTYIIIGIIITAASGVGILKFTFEGNGLKLVCLFLVIYFAVHVLFVV